MLFPTDVSELGEENFLCTKFSFVYFILLIRTMFSGKESRPLCINNDKTHDVAKCLVLPRLNHENFSLQNRGCSEEKDLDPNAPKIQIF